MSTRFQENLGQIQSIPIAALHPNPDNPFGIRDDPAMQELAESIRQFGVLVPAIARQKEDVTDDGRQRCKRGWIPCPWLS